MTLREWGRAVVEGDALSVWLMTYSAFMMGTAFGQRWWATLLSLPPAAALFLWGKARYHLGAGMAYREIAERMALSDPDPGSIPTPTLERLVVRLQRQLEERRRRAS